MKKLLFSTLLLSVFLFACQKEEDFSDTPPAQNNNNNPPPVDTIPPIVDTVPVNSFAANEALIKSGTYFICDVEGVDGIQKYNLQSYNNTADSHWGGKFCSTGAYEFTSKCANMSSEVGTDLVFSIGFRGLCPECTFEDLVQPGVQEFVCSEDKYTGVLVNLWYINNEYPIFSNLSIPLAQQGDNFLEVLEVTGTNSKWVKARFNCTLQANDGTIIRLKNGVFRSRIK